LPIFSFLLLLLGFFFPEKQSIRKPGASARALTQPNMTRANYVDYLVIALYALLMVRVGFYVLRFNRGAAEYFRGGNRIPWLVAGLSCFMSGFSAWTFTGAAGKVYETGTLVLALYWGSILGIFILWAYTSLSASAFFLATSHSSLAFSATICSLFLQSSCIAFISAIFLA